jgi:hypothetical protein
MPRWHGEPTTGLGPLQRRATSAQGPDECACLALLAATPRYSETGDVNDCAARVAAQLPILFNGDADSTRAVRPA